MTEAFIDLGAAEPWTPPDEPPQRGRRRARGLLVALVAVLAAALPGAAAPRAGALLHLSAGVQNVGLGGGRMFVTRYLGEGPHRLEAYDTGTGRALWSVELEDGQSFVFGDADVVMVSSEYGERQPLQLSVVTALDPGTGALLWRRPSAGVAGRGGGRVLLQDLTSFQQPEDGVTAPSPENRVLGADARSGALVWELLVPPGSQAAYGRDPGSPYTMRSLSVLDPDGALRRYDLRTGAVAGTARLAWSGPVGWFRLGEDGDVPGPPGARAGQVAVGGEGGLRADVYDERSGRALWHVDVEAYGGLRACAPGWWCVAGDHGQVAYDAVTGVPVLRADTTDVMVANDGGVLVLGRLAPDRRALAGLRTVDLRTGATLRTLDGWRPAFGPGDRLLVSWQADGEYSALFGQLDARTGRVTVLGAADLGAADPVCVSDERSVACGGSNGSGDVTLWPAPPRHGG
ncbi:PQQ-binding-like beta-propeller repeat protein [Dactylosporangium sp. CA-139066]|uniref:outer membrane protein assembly factor BamB family protein n=1 Tax=Dactylosporangium sp. CA-139066 TaxID=3239930 RepID=UPI003D92AE77